MPRLLATVVLASLASLAAGCASTPAIRYYTLHQPGDGTASRTGSGLRVAVASFQVDPPYDQDQLVYRLGEDAPEVGFYAYHRWAVPLARMLPLQAAQQLAGVPGVASFDPAAGDGGDPDAVLSGRLLRLEEVDSARGQGARAHLELRLEDGRGKLLWSTVVAGASDGQASEVAEIVVHMRRALDAALAQARAELAAHLDAVAAGGS